ncbi:multicopper oxidase domain-containing protein [Streptomyces sp. Li-HN-5-11]|uniref:multicopper oxidase domain-containing protein n=1 Tax=Streptomyces sp. Li-HN-5-11 TaxID=3075432 RepID=UPI0028B0ABA4|nr:multicopper oxidase domain-containing protein [Streptomyces sp. Li-HN-5-11]WNM31264.1 multicopper oxidase domain-containing protein [Streptomyces sp. Li-HN-5-11]
MTSQLDPPSATASRYPNRFKQSGLKARHLRAHTLVVAWLVLALLTTTAQQTLPIARWLAIHLFLLGAATTAIVVWSEHFAVALLHAKLPDERWSDARLAAVNLAVAGVLTGVWADLPVLIGIACALLVAAITAHLVVLVRMGRGALGGRLAPIVGFYRAAAAALVVGAVLGWMLATGHAGPRYYSGLRLAHIHVMLLGWIGLPVLGTLFMLWPTVLGVRMTERTTKVARWVLSLTGGGLVIAVAALAAGWRWAAVTGVVTYGAGAGVAVELFARTVRRRRPISSAAACTLGAATGWLIAGVIADAAILAIGPLTEASDGVGSLVPVWLAGFVAQVLIGALTYLLPIVLGTGPKERATLRAVLESGWLVRSTALNAGVALLALPLPNVVGTVGLLLAAAPAVAFLALTVRVLVRGVGRAGEGGSSRRPVLLGSAAGVVLIVLAVMVANSGGSTDGPAVAAGTGNGAATVTRTVNVTLANMRIQPGRIDVTKGTGLKLKVTNKDAQRHDLKVDGGPTTPLLSRGESRTLDLGAVTRNRTAWCTLPGHRAAGMTLAIVVKSSTGETAAGHDGHMSMAGSSGGLDLAADFSHGWKPRGAALAPVAGGTLRRIELHAVRRTIEVAPGVKQQMWTFGGTAPGPTLHGKVGDVFEVTLVNDDPTMGHGIDLHAGSLAPDQAMRTIRPGQRLVYRFRADRAGAWLYHCSTAPMLQHMGNGMYGAVIIDPPGLAKVDHEYVLVSSELYLGTPGSAVQVAKMRHDTPDAWAFNGVAAQYAKAPLMAKAGERARFWVVAAGPSDGISFHIVGTVFDTVYKEGTYLLKPGRPGGSQVLDLAVAEGGFVETTFPAGGHYSFVDHDMRHAEAGAMGMVEVSK